MSDWVQNKLPKNLNNMFHWKSKPSKPALTHGNGQGIHGNKWTAVSRDRRDNAETKSFSRTDHMHHRDALKAAYRNRGSLPQGSLQTSLPLGLYQGGHPPGSDEGTERQRLYGNSQPPGSYSGSQPPGFQKGQVPSGSHHTFSRVDSRQPMVQSETRMVNGGEIDKVNRT